MASAFNAQSDPDVGFKSFSASQQSMRSIQPNTTDDQLIQKIIKSAKKNFVTENEKNDKQYQLSASMGYAITNLSNETIDDFMNRIDEQMYQDKMKYYEHNDRRNSK